MARLLPYDREGALEYAKTWASRRNPRYYDFSALGGDCTNFISQCLVAGGMRQNMNYLGWYYKSLSSRSPSFSSTEFLYKFLTRNRATTGPVAVDADFNELEAGDLIQVTFDGVRYTHTLIIVRIADGEFYVAAHTDDSYDRPLSTYSYVKLRPLRLLGTY